MKYFEAMKIIGSLSHPSKMPCPSWGIPASVCTMGAANAKIKGSVCSQCYAKRGHYATSVTQNAQLRRLEGLKHPQWVDAMVKVIEEHCTLHFRWFDSGDIQDLDHLRKIFEIARRLPRIKFWLPTQEIIVVDGETLHWQRTKELINLKIPTNLRIRFTGPLIDVATGNAYVLRASRERWHEMVKTNNRNLWFCPADDTLHGDRKHCGGCRACWSRSIDRIVYRKS